MIIEPRFSPDQGRQINDLTTGRILAKDTIRDLVSVYGDGVRTACEGSRTLLRVGAVELPPGCRPATTPMLLVFDPDQAKPLPYVQPGQLLANGSAPRSSSNQMVGGEPWMQFSFNIPWTENDGIIRFIAAARQRVAQND